MVASASGPRSQCNYFRWMTNNRRPVTIPVRRAPKKWRRQLGELGDQGDIGEPGELSGDYWRPLTREDCKQVQRPCPYVGCRHNVYLDVTETGTIKINFPWITPLDIPANMSCALDVAERGGVTLDDIASAINLTRERVRQLEQVAIDKIFIENCCEGGILEGYECDAEYPNRS